MSEPQASYRFPGAIISQSHSGDRSGRVGGHLRKAPEGVLGMRLAPGKVEELRAQLSGELILASHTLYDASREIWNRCFDRHPCIIVRCTTVADVIAAVRSAREHDLEIAIKGGGHHASTDGGVLLDLSGLRGR